MTGIRSIGNCLQASSGSTSTLTPGRELFESTLRTTRYQEAFTCEASTSRYMPSVSARQLSTPVEHPCDSIRKRMQLRISTRYIQLTFPFILPTPRMSFSYFEMLKGSRDQWSVETAPPGLLFAGWAMHPLHQANRITAAPRLRAFSLLRSFSWLSPRSEFLLPASFPPATPPPDAHLHLGLAGLLPWPNLSRPS